MRSQGSGAKAASSFSASPEFTEGEGTAGLEDSCFVCGNSGV
jgi:hypothetical protein